MKRISVSLFYLLTFFSAFGQNALQDAIFLTRYISKNKISPEYFQVLSEIQLKIQRNTVDTVKRVEINTKLQQIDQLKRDSIFSLFRRYNLTSESALTSGSATPVNTDLHKNPYFIGIDFTGSTQAANPGVNTSVEQVFTSIGNLDVTNIALGLADFLVERTKTELNTAFFRRFQEEMNKKEYADLKILFPETQSLLSVIGVEIYQFDHYLNAMRNAFDKDLRMFQEHLPAILENHENDQIFIDNPELAPSLNLALELANWIKEERQPGEMLKLIAESDQTAILRNSQNTAFQQAINSIQFVAFISESLRGSTDTEQYWVDQEQLKKLRNPTTFKIYLGLLYEISKKDPYKQIKFPVLFPGNSSAPTEKTLPELLKKIGEEWPTLSNDIEKYRVYIATLGNETQQIMRAITVLKQTQKSILADTSSSRMIKRQRLFDASFDVFEGLTSLVNLSFEVEKLPFIKIIIPEKVKQISNYLETGGEIALHIAQKQYAGSVSKMVILLDKLLVTDDNKVVLKKILKYGTFMANIVEAETPEQAKKAIEAVALPPGSYTIKRESRFSVGLNGYLGVFGGSERIKNVETKGWNNWAITAPVGFSLSWGNICPKAMRPWSLGFFVPVVDLGAVASYRFGNTEDTVNATGEAPTIQLKHLIAPGLFVELGIGGTPLTLGLGGQFGPNLRKIENETSNVGDTYYRIGATLKVDIPLLNFYANPSKK